MRLARYLSLAMFTILLIGLIIGISAEGQAADSVRLNFQIQSSAILEVPESIDFPPVIPGETVEHLLQVLVKANVEWDLQITGAEIVLDDGEQTQDLESLFEVRNFAGSWQQLGATLNYVCLNQPPTPSTGQVVDVHLRVTGDFGDPPGSYHTQLDFTLVPKI